MRRPWDDYAFDYEEDKRKLTKRIWAMIVSFVLTAVAFFALGGSVNQAQNSNNKTEIDNALKGDAIYQIWLDNGHEGTEADFLAWLKGLNDHSFGEWKSFTTGNVPCEERMFFRVCADCNVIEWKNGSADDHDWAVETTAPTCQAQGYDTKTCGICGKVEVENYQAVVGHAWSVEYSYDNSYHWYDCETCDEIKGKIEHTPDETGECSVCKQLVGVTEGVLYDMSTDGTYAEVIGYEGTATKVRIADTYNGVPVTSIYKDSFKNKDSITEVIIPDSVTSIGSYAFSSCSSLTSVVIGDSVTSIGSSAFSSCSSLTSVEIPDSVTSIGSSAFEYCSSLTSVEIGDSVTSIGSSAFEYCSSSTYNEYGNCKYLGNENNPYHALIKVTSNNYSTYTIHEDTKMIADYAFYGCERMTNIVIPDSVTSIGDVAFSSCSSLTSVVIGDSVTSIGDVAFSSCSSLTSVEIPDSVTTIGDGAFRECSSLTSVVIPDSVTTIGEWAFYNCSSLTTVYYKGTASDWSNISISSSGNSKLTSATRYYYDESELAWNWWHYDAQGNVVHA